MFTILKNIENEMIRNRSKKFLIDQGINRKKNRKRLQQCSTRIEKVPKDPSFFD